MKIMNMTIGDFREVETRVWTEEVLCSSLVILPNQGIELHDSGFKLMQFVAINSKEEPICRMSGCSDVIHIDGIGGFGYKWNEKYNGIPTAIEPRAWSMDCLPCGLFRLFIGGKYIIRCGPSLSSFEIFSVKI